MVKVEIGSWYIIDDTVGEVTDMAYRNGALVRVEVNGWTDYDGGYFAANAKPWTW